MNNIKNIIALIFFAFCFMAHAEAKGEFAAADSGIVTPEIARGMRAYNRFNNDVNGDMVVCLEKDYAYRAGDCEKWIPVTKVIPAGRVYVGFRVVSHLSGSRQLEVYWK